MFKRSIRIGIQRLITHKAYSFINIGGLSIAIAVCLTILLYVNYHASFDKYIDNGQNAYRIISRYGEGTYSANTFAGFEEVFSNCPEIESFSVNYVNHNVDEVLLGKNKFRVESAIFANQSFIDFYSLKMVNGDMSSINNPNTILLTPRMAEKLFPNENAIGQTILLKSFTSNQDSLITYFVSGIIEPLPKTSHIKFEMLISQKGHFSQTVEMVKERKVFASLIYVKLFSAINVKNIEDKLNLLIKSVLNDASEPPIEAFNHKLQPVYDIHFTPGLNQESEPTVRRSSHKILVLVGILIIALATLNFVILYVAKASFNQKTTLIIRFFGGTKMNLFTQNIMEVFLSVSISFIMATILLLVFQVYLAEQYFNGWNISFQSINFWIIAASLFFALLLVISVLTSLNLLKKGSVLEQTVRPIRFNGAILLIIFQFVMVIALIGFTIVINLQMKFINNKDLGYSSENVLIIRVPQTNAKVNILKEELALLPGIIHTGTAQHYPGYRFQDMNFSIDDVLFPFKFGFIDHEAIETLNITVLKYFTEAKEKAKNGWMINETFYTNLRSKYSDEEIETNNYPSDDGNTEVIEIHGVMKDFHFKSLHSELENFAYYVRDNQTRFNRFVLVRYSQNNFKNLIPLVESKIEEIYPGQPVNYTFLDEEMNKLYVSEQTLLKLINAFSILSILVSCFGLIGVSIFIAEKRTKEIGIRKVNGATVFEIIKMLNLDFIKWVSISFCIASPIAYYVSQKWLQNFAYQTNLSLWIFIIAGVIALLIAIVTVSWQTYKAARKNPVEVLRYE